MTQSRDLKEVKDQAMRNFWGSFLAESIKHKIPKARALVVMEEQEAQREQKRGKRERGARLHRAL